MSTGTIYERKLRLAQCVENLTVAHAMRANERDMAARLEWARENLLWALTGILGDDAREAFEDAIAEAIDDSMDVDWTSRDAARFVADHILDALTGPDPEEETDA